MWDVRFPTRLAKSVCSKSNLPHVVSKSAVRYMFGKEILVLGVFPPSLRLSVNVTRDKYLHSRTSIVMYYFFVRVLFVQSMWTSVNDLRASHSAVRMARLVWTSPALLSMSHKHVHKCKHKNWGAAWNNGITPEFHKNYTVIPRSPSIDNGSINSSNAF